MNLLSNGDVLMAILMLQSSGFFTKRLCTWTYFKSRQLKRIHRSPKRPKTVLSGGRLREMTWWSQTNFFRDHLYHCYGFYLDRLDTPSSFSLISENQLIFRFWAIFDTKFSRYHQFEGTSSLSSVFVQLNSGSVVKKLYKNWVSYLSGGLMLPATNLKKFFFWLHGFCHGYIHGISHAYHTHF